MRRQDQKRPVRNILLVEDDEDDYILTRDMLAEIQGIDCRLQWASTFDAGLQQLQEKQFDAVLLDYDLGARNGLEFIRQAIQAGCQAPILLLTGRGSYEVDLDAMDAGAAEYLNKNEVNPPLLERSIRYAIDSKQTEAALRQARDELEERVRARTRELEAANRELKEQAILREQMSHALLETNNLLEKVFAGIHLHLAYLDRNFNFIRVNETYARAGGHEVDYYIGKNHFDLFPNTENQAIFQSVVDSGEAYYAFMRPFVYRYQVEKGVTYWDWSLQPIKAADGRVMGLVLSLFDRTEMAQNEQALRERDLLIQTAVLGSPLTLFMVDREGIVRLFLGRSLANITKNRITLGNSIYDLYQDVPAIIDGCQRTLQGETFTTLIEVGNVAFETRYAPLKNATGEIIGLVGVALDISDRRQAEEALRTSELRFRAIFEGAAIGIMLQGLDGRILGGNPALLEMLGYEFDELLAKTTTDLTEPADIWTDDAFFKLLVSGASERYRIEKRLLHKNGSIVWVRMAVSMVRDANGSPLFVIGMVENITERKQLETELSEVQRRLMDSREDERIHLAQELHDGPIQDLYAVIYQIKALEDEFSGQNASEKLVGVQDSLRNIVQVLRVVTRGLRPPTLAPFGLQKTIQSHAEGFAQENPSFQLNLELQPDGQALPERIRIALFRIYQQALANVVRHAHARQITVRFTWDAEQACLEVQDDGQGFDVPERWIDFVREGHLGLAGISERAQAVGGKLEVESAEGKGTLIRVVVPL